MTAGALSIMSTLWPSRDPAHTNSKQNSGGSRVGLTNNVNASKKTQSASVKSPVSVHGHFVSGSGRRQGFRLKSRKL